MLSRRQFLTTIAAAPLAQFCKACDHHQWDMMTQCCSSCGMTKFDWLCQQKPKPVDLHQVIAMVSQSHGKTTGLVDYDYGNHNTEWYDEIKRRTGRLHWGALPQGTLT